MEPNRPNIEAIPSKELRSSVGNISTVNTYMVLNDIVIANLLPKNNIIRIQAYSENRIGTILLQRHNTHSDNMYNVLHPIGQVPM